MNVFAQCLNAQRPRLRTCKYPATCCCFPKLQARFTVALPVPDICVAAAFLAGASGLEYLGRVPALVALLSLGRPVEQATGSIVRLAEVKGAAGGKMATNGKTQETAQDTPAAEHLTCSPTPVEEVLPLHCRPMCAKSLLV